MLERIRICPLGRGGGGDRELVQFTTALMKTGADEPAVRTALAAMCWHSSGGIAADTLRIRWAGVVDVRSLRTARRLEAPGWLAQLYAGTLVSMDKDGRIIRTFASSPLTEAASMNLAQKNGPSSAVVHSIRPRLGDCERLQCAKRKSRISAAT